MPSLFTAFRSCFKAATVATIAWAASTACLAEVLPPAWQEIRTPAADLYEVTLAGDAAFEGHYGATVRRTEPVQNQLDFGGFAQAAKADAWRGRRVAMSAWIKTAYADSAHMWLRIDAADRVLAMDNMNKRGIVGTTGWARYEIVMDVPDDAAALVFGVFLMGAGRLDFDNLRFEPAAEGVKTTTVFKENQLKPKAKTPYTPPRTVQEAPRNLDFEEVPAN